MSSLQNIICLTLGGSVGVLSRYYLAEYFSQRLGRAFPFGTFGVNLLGCLLIGFLFTWLEHRFLAWSQVPQYLRLLIFTGFLGGFTTFSSYGLETFLLLKDGSLWKAVLYATASLIFGLFFVWFGTFLARYFCSST